MGSPKSSNDTTHIPPPLSFYNTFNIRLEKDDIDDITWKNLSFISIKMSAKPSQKVIFN